jgi:hypothetical protein
MVFTKKCLKFISDVLEQKKYMVVKEMRKRLFSTLFAAKIKRFIKKKGGVKSVFK